MSEAKNEEVSLLRQMARGSFWTMCFRWSVRLTGLVSTVILARLLTPEDYGIVAIAMVIVGTIESFSQSSQRDVIVRHPDPTREHYDSAWTMYLLIGLACAVVLLIATPLTTYYFHEPRARPVVWVLALRFALSGTENIGTLNFRRHLRFDRQFVYTVWPAIASFVATVTSAFILRNYWALIIGVMTEQIVSIILSYVMEPYRPRICFTKVAEIWSFSIWMLLKNIGYFFFGQIELIAIGGVVGASSMGRYEVALDVATSPSQEIVNPVVTTMFPVLARVQNDPLRRRELYLSTLYWLALICVATSVGVALVSDDMVDLVLGAKWQNIKPLMPWFALSFGVFGLSSGVYSIFDSIGRPHISARLQWMRLLVLALVVFPVAYYYKSLLPVAIARFLVMCLITPTLFYALAGVLDLSLGDFVRTLWRPSLAGLGMVAAVLSLNAFTPVAGVLRLFGDIVLGAGVFGGLTMLLWLVDGQKEGPERVVLSYLAKYSARLRGSAA